MLTAKEMSSLLSTRYMISDPSTNRLRHPHQDWDTVTRVAIVILWGLLIYPQLDPKLKKSRPIAIDIKQFRELIISYLEDNQACIEILYQLKKFDYIRCDQHKIVPGTRLFISVDASKMYRFFRASMLSRELFTYWGE